jgi:hypothetical protein
MSKITIDNLSNYFPDIKTHGLQLFDLPKFFGGLGNNKFTTGLELNRIFLGMKFIKFIKRNRKQMNNYVYQVGLNIDKPLHPGRCPGGLFFTVLPYYAQYVNWGDDMCVVTIPDNAEVYIDYHCFKADQLIISDIQPKERHALLSDPILTTPSATLIEIFQWILTKNDCQDAFRHFTIQTELLCRQAIKLNPNNAIYVKEKYIGVNI